MRRSLKTISFLFVTLIVAIFAQDISARCVECAPSGACFTCKPSQKGGCECSPVRCEDCVISIACRKDTTSGDYKCPTDEILASGVKIDEATILAIGQVHPRFATMLASLNKLGGLKSWSRVTSFPARLDASEVKNWLKPPAETKAFFQEYNKRHVAGAPLIVYEFTLSKLDDTRILLSAQVVQAFPDDPPANGLEIELVNGQVARWNLK